PHAAGRWRDGGGLPRRRVAVGQAGLARRADLPPEGHADRPRVCRLREAEARDGAMTIKRLDLLQPTTLAEACQLYQEHADDVSYIAGGTALLIMLRERVYQPGYLVDLKTIPGLDGIRHEPGAGLRLGALASHRDVELSPVVRDRLPVLADTYRQVGNVRVRHAATVGGNLAHGDFRLDPPAPLIALHASARIVRADGERTVPLEEFFLG